MFAFRTHKWSSRLLKKARWFLDMEVTDEPFAPMVFSKNRDRLLEHDIAGVFFSEVLSFAGQRQLLSRDHFTVDGTLIEAWASHKSLRRRDGSDDDQPPPDDPGNPTLDFRGERRSVTDLRSLGPVASARARTPSPSAWPISGGESVLTGGEQYA